MKWLKKAALHGDVKSMMFIGQHYSAAKQYKDAFFWFKKATKGGSCWCTG